MYIIIGFPVSSLWRKRGEMGVHEEEMSGEMKRKSCAEREKEETKECAREETLVREERGLPGIVWGERTCSSSRESV